MVEHWETQSPQDAPTAVDPHHSPEVTLADLRFVCNLLYSSPQQQLEVQHYHIIYEGWPSGMQVKQEYQLRSPAALLQA